MSAIISQCGTYRYRLEREGPGDGATAIIMVNPSTADGVQDDATIRKLRGFGQRYEWGRLMVGNLFAYRATDVRELATASDPIGPGNDAELGRIFQSVQRVVFAWGPTAKLPKRLRDRWRQVAAIAAWGCDSAPQSIGAPAKDGHPCHPLMLPYSRTLQDWTAP